MRSFKKMSLVAAALMASTAMVQAADIISTPNHDLPPEVVPTSSAGGWYIRGDIGYADVDYNSTTRFFQGGSLTGVLDRDVDETYVLQGGIGYQVTDYFRIDGTVAYYDDIDTVGFSRSIGSVAAPGAVACVGGGPAECLFTDTQSFDSTVVLANAYIDLGTINHFSAYIGGGIGGAYVDYGNLTNQRDCVVAAPTDPANCTSLTDTHSGESEWRFAWAVHAGATYDFNCRVKADVGYTYTRIESGEAFGFPQGSGIRGPQGFDSDIEIHSGRAGLRYALSDAGCYTPPPPVYK